MHTRPQTCFQFFLPHSFSEKKYTMLIMFQSDDMSSSLKLASEHATDVLEPARVVGVGADRMNSS